MSAFDDQYISLCNRVIEHGNRVETNPLVSAANTGMDVQNNMPSHTAQIIKPTVTYSLPHQILTFDLGKEFPILTSKFVAFKSAVIEMLWIYQAQSNDVRWLQERGVKIWNEWEIDENGYYNGKNFGKEFAHTIGTAYGWIVNKYNLTNSLIETIKTDKTNRRMVMSLWQNEWIKTAVLPSCVWNTQWDVSNGKLNLLVNARSNDIPLGLPFNVTQYAVLCYLIAHCTGLEPGIMTYVMNNAHIYENQIDGIKLHIEQATKYCRENWRYGPRAPKLWINPNKKDFFDFDNSSELKDIKLIGYEHLGKISIPVTE